jgi:hypothetical protein
MKYVEGTVLAVLTQAIGHMFGTGGAQFRAHVGFVVIKVPLECFLHQFIFILPINIPPALCFNSAVIRGMENESLKAAGQRDKDFFNPIIK